MNNSFPRMLTLLRKERGLSQKAAAQELGVSQALLSHYEKGSGNAAWRLLFARLIFMKFPAIIY